MRSDEEFLNKLIYADEAAGLVSSWLGKSGHKTTYNGLVNSDTGRGPRANFGDESFALPDFMAFKEDGSAAFWVEVKRASTWDWYKNGQVWSTGIDGEYYYDYCNIEDRLSLKVMIYFMMDGGISEHRPKVNSPSGLYGASLRSLRDIETKERFSKPWVFYTINELTFLASLKELRSE